jgi:DNA-binding NtrC family response regulator
VNCGAFTETLLESELFGHEKDAFTGANARKPGRVELADGGTLFLDEVGELSPAAQVRLLRVLQEKEVQRVGGTAPIKVDVRFVAATHRDLPAMVKEGKFREDLFFRLNVIPVSMPALRKRPEDIEPLAKHFLSVLGPQNGRPKAAFSSGALALISSQSWTGNVRQLQNFIERLTVLAPDGDLIDENAVKRELGRMGPDAVEAPAANGDSLPERRKDAERQAVEEALKKAKGNRALAARLLGVSRRTLYNKLDSLGLAET